jgi:hypothetical protein
VKDVVVQTKSIVFQTKSVLLQAESIVDRENHVVLRLAEGGFRSFAAAFTEQPRGVRLSE